MPVKLTDIETPALIVDEPIALRNIAAFQNHCDREGLSLRPHIKTHKSIRFAKAQIAQGAVGITCQKISEAEVMAVEGIDDITITFNILGEAKLKRLLALSRRLKLLTVVADNHAVVEGLSSTFSDQSDNIKVLVECDTGAKRCGVQSPEEAVSLAETMSKLPGIEFVGLMTYPATGGSSRVVEFMRETKKLLDLKNIACPIVSSGGSPDMWSSATHKLITEYRIGTYIYNDRSLIRQGTCTEDDCAAHVLATVVSTPTASRAVIDAGSKVLTSDLLGFSDHGLIVGYPEVSIVGLSEEHGVLRVDPTNPLRLGQKIRIIPNHVCVVSNMFDAIWVSTDGAAARRVPVDARGMVT